MMVSEDLSRGEWELRITEIRHSDAGSYECQINTNPLLSHTIVLTVVGIINQIGSVQLKISFSEPYTEIFGDSLDNTNNLYIDIRSILNLTCVVYSPEVPAAIFWKHNGKVIECLFKIYDNTLLYHKSCWILEAKKMEPFKQSLEKGDLPPEATFLSLLLT